MAYLKNGQSFSADLHFENVHLLRKQLDQEFDDVLPTPPERVERRKAIAIEMRRRFQRELRILDLLRLKGSPRIVELLGSYEQKGPNEYESSYNFIFPLADKDLDKFLLQDPKPKDFCDNSAFLEELYGLASALNDVHEFRFQFKELDDANMELLGCHHDLKPSNILVFGNRFVLADFGLSRLSAVSEGSKSRFKDVRGDYFAPECMDEDYHQQRIGRSSDIWSFGCVIAEIATFIENGAGGVRNFRERRFTRDRPYNRNSWFHSSGELKAEVEEWLRQLSTHTSDEDLRSLVQLTREMLNPLPHRRPTSKAVLKQLAYISLKSLYRHIVRLYESILDGFGNFNLATEKTRLDEWAMGLGIDNRGHDGERPCDIVEQIGEQIREVLKKLKEVLESAPVKIQTHPDADDAVQVTFVALREGIDALWKLIPQGKQEFMRKRWQYRRLRASTIEGITEIKQQTRNPHEKALASMKQLVLFMEEHKSPSETHLKERSFVTLEGRLGEHHIGWYNFGQEETPPGYKRARVLIEWKHYDDKLGSHVDKEIYARMDAIAELPNEPGRPAEFRVLDCAGYFLDGDELAFGMMYNFPADHGNSISTRVATLEGIINENQSVTKLKRPALGDRFRLAKSLVFCITEFHAVGWLHKNICSQNIVFFTKNQSEEPPPIGEPYVIGFNHSRPDSDDLYTLMPSVGEVQKLYQHPEYRAKKPREQNLRFRRSFDYYSLGVVLLEIGMWHTIGKLIAGVGCSPGDTYNHFMERARQLGPLMGTLYRDATLYCLQESSEQDTEDFYRMVVEPLSRCNV
jgi:serine/threonine protein kinase